MTAIDENSAIRLLQVMKVEAGNDTGKKLNIIWDGGATVSLITTRKAAELEFEGTPSFSDRSWLCQETDPISEVYPPTQR